VIQQDPRLAARDRDLGLRRIGRTTWRAGLAAAACSAVLGVALSQHTPATASSSGGAGGGGSNSAGRTGGGSATHEPDNQGSIVIPAQPPGPAGGAAHVATGGS
jgi:hypothetical protein